MRAMLTVAGKDRTGVIAKISNTLFEHNVNIMGGDLFAMIMLVELKDCDISFPSLTAQLEAAGVELGMKVHLMHEDIFNAMHRI